jgi:HD-GYP domain-containing protein (c-di-GMP phosphodiesterase class II)
MKTKKREAMEKNQSLMIICKAGEALQIALTQRDEYTQLHCQRVAQIAVQTGKHFGFDDSLLVQLETALFFMILAK